MTNYGQRPPQGKVAREIEPKPAPVPTGSALEASQQGWREKEREFRTRQVEADQAEERQKQQSAMFASWCIQARRQVKEIQDSRTVFDVNDKGERVFLNEAERNATLARHEQTIAQRCR